MATQFDTIFRDVGRDLVDLFGLSTGNSTYISVAKGGLDLSTGEIAEVLTEFDIKMTPPLGYKKGDIDGSVVQTHDTYVFISGQSWDTKALIVPTSSFGPGFGPGFN